MKKVIRIPFVLVILLVLIGILCIKVNAATTGVITEITVNVREEASLDSNIIMFVTQDDEVDIIEKTGDWYKIKYNNTEGYVYADFVKVKEEVSDNNTQTTQNTNLETEDEEVTQTIEPALQIAKNTGVKIAPSITSNIIYTSSKNEEVQLLEQINNWSYIQLTNIKGWVRNSQLQEITETSEEKTETKETQTAYVQYDNVNLRKEPSTDSSIIERLTLNTEVTILETVDSVWCRVKVGENTGYISKELLSSEKQEDSANTEENNETTSRSGDTTNRDNTSDTQEKTDSKESSNSSTTITGADIVAYAKQYLGYDYVYGGSSPKTGFDCSGFTSYVYQHFGYSLSRSSVGQASNGNKISKDDLQPGDLVIYKNTSLTRIGHVGIYIGDNKMIHASEPGVGVTITDIDSKAHNYPRRYVMARRIID